MYVKEGTARIGHKKRRFWILHLGCIQWRGWAPPDHVLLVLPVAASPFPPSVGHEETAEVRGSANGRRPGEMFSPPTNAFGSPCQYAMRSRGSSCTMRRSGRHSKSSPRKAPGKTTGRPGQMNCSSHPDKHLQTPQLGEMGDVIGRQRVRAVKEWAYCRDWHREALRAVRGPVPGGPRQPRALEGPRLPRDLGRPPAPFFVENDRL